MRSKPPQLIVIFGAMVEWAQDKIIDLLWGRATHIFYLGRDESPEVSLSFQLFAVFFIARSSLILYRGCL